MKHFSVVALLAIFIFVPAVSAMDLGQRDVFTFGNVTKISDNEVEVSIMVNHD